MNRDAPRSTRLTARRREALGFGLSAALLALLFLVSFSVGRFPVAVLDLIHLVWSKFSGVPSGLPGNVEAVVFNVRGPGCSPLWRSARRSPLQVPPIKDCFAIR